ncbi:glycosyl hydrolase family 39 [uncultured Mucilaginibacter sp.]|uniref:GH39 family glycosyl hydrolase n=1 Tax=uncultured Mucilaginibacter sp. TaxID=797541 RepID=UPI0025E0D331|nr:glycosyl hydrolase family 39 [uncultured Mucilaginibacter sp.]
MRKSLTILLFSFAACLCNAQTPQLKVQWDVSTGISKSTPTLQVVGNPMLRKSGSMHGGSFGALKNLGADYVRYVPWFPYPKLAVAELDAPTATKTSWDFSLIDPMTIDFLEATKGHCVIMNFSTIPQWMFKTDYLVSYPAEPNEVAWSYGGGTAFRDTTLKELTGYYVRLLSWYTKGGFTDELGAYHKSGYHYDIPYWEILNEPEFEHNFTPQAYTKVYDAVVTALHKEFPKMKFVGMALAFEHPEWFEYFLNPANHKPGIPLDFISYHCYSNANNKQTFDAYEYTLFDKADNFLNTVSFVESIRKRLSPNTKTTIDELGTFVSNKMRDQPITPVYWNLSAAVYTYFFIGLSRQGIDVIGESQLVGFPSQYPDVSMINYVNNKPNARYWVLKLIKDNIHSGDTMVTTSVDGDGDGDFEAQGFVNNATKKVLIINKRNKTVILKLPATFKGAKMSVLDETCSDRPAFDNMVNADSVALKPFAVSLITLNN